MKLGLFTAAFPGRPLDTIADFAAAAGYEALEIACWPPSRADRRYAGVTHIDAAGLVRAEADAILAALGARGLSISSLGYYPNPLARDPAVRRAAAEHIKAVVDAAALLGVSAVGTFVGRDKDKDLEANLEEFKSVWPPLVAYAEERGVRIAIENCPMLFSADEWPGGCNLAVSPAVWERLWEICPSDYFGLNLDPSHLIWQMIDPVRVVRDYGTKIFHVHAKDLMIDAEGLYRHGVLSAGRGWQVPRLPGLGQVDWKAFIAALYRAGYDYIVSVEHEDRDFEGDEALVERGFLIARDALRPYIH
jgi:sugar phosphate isomerase/epimerase